MDIIEYIKKYCDGKWSVFKSKNLPSDFKQTAFHDITTYHDYENGIDVEDRNYIGD